MVQKRLITPGLSQGKGGDGGKSSVPDLERESGGLILRFAC